jgi:hypothetical protein
VIRRNEHFPIIEFGKEYRDRISGFVGVCTGKSSFISGCDQVLLVPKIGEDGSYKDGHWFDDERLISVESERPVQRTSRRGGPQQTPKAR